MDDAFIPALSDLVMSLGDQLPRIEAEIAGAELYGAPRLSAFQLLAPNENALSRVIADLLDCRGSHGQGELFLNHFLEEAKLPTVGPRDTRHVKVTKEFLTDDSRRIDI